MPQNRLPRVVLVCMPFQSITSPASGIGLLKSELTVRGIDCDVEYLNLKFANAIDPGVYEAVADQWFIGELMFSELLGDTDRRDGWSSILPGKLIRTERAGRKCIIDLDYARGLASDFLDECLRSVNWPACQIVGFTLTYQQTAPALALARLVKKNWPNTCIVLGGVSCLDEMGAEIHRQYPFVDYVFSGEADEVFPDFVCRFSEQSERESDGVIRRGESGDSILPAKSTARVMNLDSIPYPDYDDYFDQLRKFEFKGYPFKVSIPVETSRGCWWGEKSRCIFCGFNDLAIAYRSKSATRVLNEIGFLKEKYGNAFSRFEVVDSVLDPKYFTTVFPRLAQDGSAKPMFFYTKSNLTKPQVRLLAKAGVWAIQPGIESLSTPILQLMNKGCSMLQNVELLKSCREYGIDVLWNFLYGIPDEDPAEYDRMRIVIDRITHLQPPLFMWKVTLHRFSRLYVEPQKYGVINIRPNRWYREIFALSDQSLSRIAYSFEFDYGDKRNPEEYVKNIKQDVERWRQSYPDSKLLATRSMQGMEITTDTRPYVRHRQEGVFFESPYADVIEYCDQTRHLSAIESYLKKRNRDCSKDQLERCLASLVESGIVLEEKRNYLSLPILLGEPASSFGTEADSQHTQSNIG